jgi:hypothetical protein
MASIREVGHEETGESWTLRVIDAGGESRELHVTLEGAGLRITVFHGTEHALIPLDGPQARSLALWLDAHLTDNDPGRLLTRPHDARD